MKKTIVTCLLLISLQGLWAQKNTNSRTQWFVEDRFGMFIHWGIYSAAEGVWRGEALRHNNHYAEWIQYRNGISKADYLTLAEKIDWWAIAPEQWVMQAKEAGMKYIVLTAKHHDGFCLWDSEVSNYDIGAYTQRDLIGELAEACRKYHIKLGFYYSHWIDWEHPNGWSHDKEITGISVEDYNNYWQQKVLPQVRELLTKYDDIAMFWFDMWIHHSQTCITKKQLLQLKKLIRELQPNCLINSRLGLSMEEDADVDFQTLGDNQLGSHKQEFPWQSPATIAHSWGYNVYETNYKSTTTLLQALINNVSLNGNYLLNIGPRANGQIPYEVVQRLSAIGQWLNTHGEAIYQAQAFDLRKDLHDWGKITCNNELNRLYLHIFRWPLNGELTLTGVNTKASNIYLLEDLDKTPLAFTQKGPVTKITLPKTPSDPYIPVLVVEYSQLPEITVGLVAKNQQGGFACTPQNRTTTSSALPIIKKQRYGTIPAHVAITDNQTLSWRIYITEPATHTLTCSYSYPGVNPVEIKITAANTTITNQLPYTGTTIGEPNSDWEIPRFRSIKMGKIKFPKPGYYTIEMAITPQTVKPMAFQWLWLE